MVYRFGNFRLDADARLLERNGQPLDVPRRVFDCLVYLVEQRERAVGRDELIERVWHRDNVTDNRLAQTVLAARRLLDDDGAQQRLIRTVPGFGFRFVAQVESGNAAAPGTGESAALAIAQVAEAADPVAVAGAEAPAREAVQIEVSTIAEAEPLLTGVSRPASGTVPGRTIPTRAWLAGAVSLALIAAGVGLLSRRQDPPDGPVQSVPARPGWVWVLPAQIDGADEDWARVAVASLVAERLRHNGAVVVPMDNVRTRFPLAPPTDLAALRRELAAGEVLVPSIQRVGADWRVDLRGAGAIGPLQASAVDRDLLEAARHATDQLTGAPARGGDGALQERFDAIAQLIHSRDFEAAHRQLARLPDRDQSLPEAELLRIGLDIEQGRHAQAGERAVLLRARLDSARHPAVAGRLELLEVRLMRHRGEAGWDLPLARALSLLRAHGTPRDLGAALVQHGNFAAIGGDYRAAGEDFAQAQRQFLGAADEIGAALAGEALAKVALMQGHPAEALRQVQDSYEVYSRYGAVGRQFLGLRGMLSIQFGMLRWSDAEVTLARMQALLPQLSDPDERTEYLRGRMLLVLATGQLREAAALLDESESTPGEESAESLRNADLYRMQLELARGRHGEVAAGGAASYARVDGGGGADTVPRRDQRELALYLWFEARRRLRAEHPSVVPELGVEPAPLAAPTTPFGWLARGHRLRERDETPAAEAAYRQALRMAQEFNRSSRVLAASDALIRLLLDEQRVAEASQVLSGLLARDAGLPERDFESALLLARVRRAEGDVPGWRRAVTEALRLAGERELPPELLLLPPAKP